MRKKVGRPLNENRAATKEAKRFFDKADDAELRLVDIHKRLRDALGEDKCPSYRTLQEWRRGKHTPLFVPFKLWEREINLKE